MPGCTKEEKTTLMLHVSRNFDIRMCRALLDQKFKGCYDFLYVPMNYSTKKNNGHAFVNMTTSNYAKKARRAFKDDFVEYASGFKQYYRPCWAKIQGIQALVKRYQKSEVMLHEEWKPWFREGILEAMKP